MTVARIKVAEAYVSRVRELEEALEEIRRMQSEALARFRQDGTVFRGDGGAWESVAFKLYTDLCEVEAIASRVLR